MARQIDDLDFNTLRNKIAEVIGPGSASFGYGQDIKSSTVSSPSLITKQQWDGLRFDLLNIYIHQNGVTPTLVTVQKGDVIGDEAGDPLRAYDRSIDSLRANRFLLAPGQSIVSAVSTKTYTSAWSSSASMTAQLTFSSADNARFFFNSGGKIRFTSSRTGGTSSPQNNAWTNILASVGTVEFGGNTDTLNFYQLTNSYRTRFEASLSTPYSANRYRIEAISNVANNSTGTATSITFRVSWIDSYIDRFPSIPPGDVVNGTLSITIEEVKASGLLQPSGGFTISSPGYTVSNISAS